ncbi:MAG: PASTA domain-containing protein [Clostridia bacterium]|nr:PASTA domain-containing protein [Clostridia bacterium]
MINSDNLCMSCMKDIGDLKTCPHCGFHSSTQQISPYLPIRTVLGNRYLVGKLLSYNGDGATYIGLDLSTRSAINIREFYPEGIANRDPKTLAVYASEQNRALYNECLHGFVEMWRKLMRLSGLSALIKVSDVLEGNGTCYAITENIDGITLREYLLRNNTGYISWEKARPLLMPVLSTLGTLHSSGIIHRAISPSTLIVAPDGKIRITGFSISQVRSARSELNHQLFNGYAAFEQYGFEGRQGAWTDIYGFGAVLYRTLIGTDPIDATERVTNDRLMVPGKFAEQLPAYVINGLVNALQILPEDRTHSVEELRAELSASPSAVAVASREFNTPVAPVVQQQSKPKYQTTAQRLDFEEEEDPTAGKREAAQRRHYFSTIIVAAALVIIVVVVGFIVLEATHVTNFFSDETTTASAQKELVEVLDFRGMEYSNIINDEYNNKNFTFKRVDTYSENVEKGVVISQSIGVGENVEKGAVITLYVSMGKESIRFPSNAGEIIGQTYENAEKHLKNLGFNVIKTPKQNIDNQTAGTVAGHNAEPGKEYDKGTTITLYVWEEPETSTLASEDPTEDSSDLFPGDSSDVLSDILDNNPFVW